MKKIILLFGLCAFFSCKNGCKDDACKKPGSTAKVNLSDGAIANNSDTVLSCKLTSEELQKRKETVLELLKKKTTEKKELSNGYAFKFDGSDSTIDQLTDFVKTERTCCNFFVFTLSFSGDGKETWLSLTGPEGTKEMISDELGL